MKKNKILNYCKTKEQSGFKLDILFCLEISVKTKYSEFFLEFFF